MRNNNTPTTNDLNTKESTMTSATETRMNKITLDEIISTHNGKAATCCCGCAGTHSYPTDPLLRALAGYNRGYAIDDDEANDRKMANVLRKLNQNLTEVEDEETYFSFETPTRLYVAYKMPVA